MPEPTRSTSLAARGMLAGIVIGAIASTLWFLSSGSGLAFILVGFASAVGLLVGAVLDRRARGAGRG